MTNLEKPLFKQKNVVDGKQENQLERRVALYGQDFQNFQNAISSRLIVKLLQIWLSGNRKTS
jgi:hypothetical protein